jgi:hypothetical protein
VSVVPVVQAEMFAFGCHVPKTIVRQTLEIDRDVEIMVSRHECYNGTHLECTPTHAISTSAVVFWGKPICRWSQLRHTSLRVRVGVRLALNAKQCPELGLHRRPPRGHLVRDLAVLQVRVHACVADFV